jgi:hypothetical protein
MINEQSTKALILGQGSVAIVTSPPITPGRLLVN